MPFGPSPCRFAAVPPPRRGEGLSWRTLPPSAGEGRLARSASGERGSWRDLPRLAAFIQRDEGEFALGHERFRLAVPFPRQGFGLEAQGRAALLQQIDI